jgi:hypothetical protein
MRALVLGSAALLIGAVSTTPQRASAFDCIVDKRQKHYQFCLRRTPEPACTDAYIDCRRECHHNPLRHRIFSNAATATGAAGSRS